MCNDITEIENTGFLKKRAGVSRRAFGAMAGAGALGLPAMVTACSESEATAQSIVEADIDVPMPDGPADCYFVHPAKGAHAAVIIWPDIMALRPAFKTMAKRLAMSGYCVLAVNPYYRTAKHPVMKEGENFGQPEVRARLRPMAGTLNPQTIAEDTQSFLAFLDAQPSVDTSRKVGVTGYCMTGSFALRGLAGFPDRIGAAGSFHGGGLVSDAQDSPHKLAPQMSGGVLIAIAQNDDERAPDDKDTLRRAFDGSSAAAEIEVYPAQHGWCPPDSVVHDEVQAERAWARLLALFETHLS